jgi:hypothetical protein
MFPRITRSNIESTLGRHQSNIMGKNPGVHHMSLGFPSLPALPHLHPHKNLRDCETPFF